MGTENNFLKIRIVIKDNIWWENFVEKDAINGLMELYTRDNFIMAAVTGMVHGNRHQ